MTTGSPSAVGAAESVSSVSNAARTRLVSLDAFRGMTMAAMVIVNNPGTWNAIYPPLRHAEWIGCTPTDLIFPFFLFIVGASMAFSLARHEPDQPAGQPAGHKPAVPWGRVLRRAVILFGLGLLLAAVPWPGWSNLRIPGVLQRIALCYLLAVPVVVYLKTRWQVLLAALLLAGYWAILKFPPSPDSLLPDAASKATDWPSDILNWPRTIDRALLGAGHLYAKAATDPESLLGTLPALVTVLMGVWTGRAIRRGSAPWSLFAAGALVAAAGFGLSYTMPLSKPLWTPTYVLFSGGLAIIGLAAWLVLADRLRVRALSAPFAMLGQNAIVLFVGSGLVARALNMITVPRLNEATATTTNISLKSWLYEAISARLTPPQLASLAFAMATVAVWTGILLILHKRSWHLKV